MQFLCRVVWKGLCFLLNSAYYWYIALIAGNENPPLIKLWVLCKTNLTTQDLRTFPFIYDSKLMTETLSGTLENQRNLNKEYGKPLQHLLYRIKQKHTEVKKKLNQQMLPH